MFSFDVNTRYDDNVSKMYNFAKTGQLESFKYSLFHKTLPKSSLKMHWISVRFYEMGVNIQHFKYLIQIMFYYFSPPQKAIFD